jgi:tetratricopeptide (TPR) repeat protein
MNISSFNKGNQSYKEKNYREALKHYKTAIDENPACNYFACNHMMGNCYYLLDEHEKALKELLYASKYINIGLEQLYTYIGHIYKKKHDFNNAVINYKKCLEQNSENVNCSFWLNRYLKQII